VVGVVVVVVVVDVVGVVLVDVVLVDVVLVDVVLLMVVVVVVVIAVSDPQAAAITAAMVSTSVSAGERFTKATVPADGAGTLAT
jgi:hypothetical protein